MRLLVSVRSADEVWRPSRVAPTSSTPRSQTEGSLGAVAPEVFARDSGSSPTRSGIERSPRGMWRVRWRFVPALRPLGGGASPHTGVPEAGIRWCQPSRHGSGLCSRLPAPRQGRWGVLPLVSSPWPTRTMENAGCADPETVWDAEAYGGCGRSADRHLVQRVAATCSTGSSPNGSRSGQPGPMRRSPHRAGRRVRSGAVACCFQSRSSISWAFAALLCTGGRDGKVNRAPCPPS